MGPGRGLVDVVKERQGAALGISEGLSSVEDEAAETSGVDWREIAERNAVVVERYKRLGLPVPSALAGVGAKQASKPPEEE